MENFINFSGIHLSYLSYHNFDFNFTTRLSQQRESYHSVSQSKVDLESTLGYCWIVEIIIAICNKSGSTIYKGGVAQLVRAQDS